MRRDRAGWGLGLILLMLGGIGCGRPTEARVTLVNATGKALSEMTLRAGAWRSDPVSMAIGGSVTLVFKGSPGKPCPYSVMIRWPEGRWVAQVGFVQSGLVYRDVVSLGREGVELRSEQSPSGEEAQPLRSEQSVRWVRLPSRDGSTPKKNPGGVR